MRTDCARIESNFLVDFTPLHLLLPFSKFRLSRRGGKKKMENIITGIYVKISIFYSKWLSRYRHSQTYGTTYLACISCFRIVSFCKFSPILWKYILSVSLMRYSCGLKVLISSLLVLTPAGAKKEDLQLVLVRKGSWGCKTGRWCFCRILIKCFKCFNCFFVRFSELIWYYKSNLSLKEKHATIHETL